MDSRSKRPRLSGKDEPSSTETSLVSFSSLFTFIRHNRQLPKLPQRIRPQHTEVNKLLEAIKSGDYQATIFKHPDCYIYLLNLILTNKITNEIALTVYAYLLALSQYSPSQPIKASDADTKSARELAIYRLSENGALTAEGRLYLTIIQDRFEELLSIELDINALEKYIVNLPPTEQWLLSIQNHTQLPSDLRITHDDGQQHTDTLKAILALNLPFITHHTTDDAMDMTLIDSLRDPNYFLCIPSVSVISKILQLISPSPIHITPVFGMVGLETLHKLHTDSQHPAAIYSTRVAKNLVDADGYHAGPYVSWLHDIGHVFFGSLLSDKEREIIFNTLIPLVKDAIRIATETNQPAIHIEFYKTLIQRLGDLDLSPIDDYKTDDKFSVYLRNCLHYATSEAKHNMHSMNREREKSIFLSTVFLTLNLAYNSHSYPSECRNAIKAIIPALNFIKLDGSSVLNVHYYRYYTSLITLADNNLFDNTDIPIQLTESVKLQLQYASKQSPDWQAWQMLLAETDDSDEIFEKILTTYSDDYFTLIIDFGFSFYHPVIPLTPAIIKQLQDLVEEQMTPTTPIDFENRKQNVAFFKPLNEQANTKNEKTNLKRKYTPL